MYKKQNAVTHRTSHMIGRTQIDLPDNFSPASEDGAYWLGWLTANTTVAQTKVNGVVRRVATIYTSASEETHLLDCLTFIGIDSPKVQKNTTKTHVSYRSVPLARLLERYNIIPSRDERSIPSIITPDLMIHYIRGFIVANSIIGIEQGSNRLYMDIQAPTILLTHLVRFINTITGHDVIINKREITVYDSNVELLYNTLVGNGQIATSEVYHVMIEKVVSEHDRLVNPLSVSI